MATPPTIAKVYAQKCVAFKKAGDKLCANILQHSQQLIKSIAGHASQRTKREQLEQLQQQHTDMVLEQIGQFESRLTELAAIDDKHNFDLTYRLATSYLRSSELLLLRSYRESGIPLPVDAGSSDDSQNLTVRRRLNMTAADNSILVIPQNVITSSIR